MNEIPTPQEAAEINGNIVDFDIFWGSIQKGIKWPYSNNFFACFRNKSTLLEFKKFLDQNIDNYNNENIHRYVVDNAGPKKKWINGENINKRTTQLVAFAEYYRAFPKELEKLIEMTNSFESISTEIGNHVLGKVHNLTDEYQNGLYHAYAYMRTQPGTSDAMLTA